MLNVPQSPLQQSVFTLQMNAALSGMQPQVPPAQEPVQHWVLVVQFAPSARQPPLLEEVELDELLVVDELDDEVELDELLVVLVWLLPQ